MRLLVDMGRRRIGRAGIAACAALFCLAATAPAATFDLYTEYSTVSNPTPTGWGFNRGGLGGTLFTSFGSYSSGDFAGLNFGWREDGPDHLGWSQVGVAPSGDPLNPVFFTQADTFDLLVGDIITHASTSVTWTADAITAGVYSIEISAFQFRDLDRADTLQLWLNDTLPLTNPVTVANNIDPANSSRAAPLSIASDVIVDLQPGDFVRLLVDGNDYVSVNQFTLTPSVLPPDRTWRNDTPGDWSNATNWQSALLPDNTSTATFGAVITVPRTVYTDTAVTTKGVKFDNANSYVIAGAGSVNLEAATGNSSLSVLQGTHEFQIRVNMNNNTDADIAAGATLEFNNRLSLGGHTLTKTGDGALKINNVLNAGGGSIVVMAGSVGGGGLVPGDLTNTSGTVAPGNSPGHLSVLGNYSQSAAGTLSVEIAGHTAGTQYDQLSVSGNATLGGTLAVTLLGGFVPSLGDSFDVLTYASHTGTFSSITGAALGGHLALKPDYGSTALLLKARPAQDGDINLDGVVNIFDINSVSANWGTAGPQGDSNGDGTVNIFDINLISSNWGATGGSATAVPEPSCLLLAFCGLSTAVLGWRRVRR